LFPYRPAELAQAAAPIMAACLALSAAALFWRRTAGALSEPLTTAGMFAAGATLAALAALVRLAWRAGGPTGNGSTAHLPTSGLLVDCGLSALLVVIAASISLPGSRTAGLLSLWGPVLLGECAWWTTVLIGPRARWTGRSRAAESSGRCAPAAAGAAPSETGSPPAPEQTVQQVIRTRMADGEERLSGWLRLDFAPGQRTAVAHLAFCPPLEGPPTLSVRQRSGPECRVKSAQVLPYGARIELRLVREASQNQQVVLEFEAHN
jgi:hypothetical protein